VRIDWPTIDPPVRHHGSILRYAKLCDNLLKIWMLQKSFLGLDHLLSVRGNMVIGGNGHDSFDDARFPVAAQAKVVLCAKSTLGQWRSDETGTVHLPSHWQWPSVFTPTKTSA
jgi:hypothetical protein